MAFGLPSRKRILKELSTVCDSECKCPGITLDYFRFVGWVSNSIGEICTYVTEGKEWMTEKAQMRM